MEKTHTGFTFSVNTIPETSSEDTQRLEVLVGNDDIGSKKLLKTDNDLHSSTIAVLGNDDLLIEILLRLPVLSLHLFKSVSKRWLTLITSPDFTFSRNRIPKIDPTAGLLIFRTTFEMGICQAGYNFESLDIRIPSKGSIVFTVGSDAPPGFACILQSCNGLLLCCVHPDKYYVYNPTTKLFKTLPIKSPVRTVKMAFDPIKSPHYKVIQAEFIHDDEHEFGCYVQIQTYSSENDNISVCGDRFSHLCFTSYKDGIYWNDAIHWVNSGYNMSSHCKLEIENDHPVLTKIQFPGTFAEMSHFPSKLFESRDSLLLLCMDKADSRHMTTFEMRNGYTEWLVKYIVNLDDIMIPTPSISMWKISHRVWSIILGERDEDSFMIIDVLNKVVQYNPVLKTVRTLCGLESIESTMRTSFDGFHFTPSFAGV